MALLDSDSVHPRGHGERFDVIKLVHAAAGSSPWARGTPEALTRANLPERFIPVGTGNADKEIVFIYGLAVHPRGHGERP